MASRTKAPPPGHGSAQLEKRILYVTTGFVILAVLLMLISISTDYWVILNIAGGSYRNASRSYVVQHYSGLWRICRTEIDNSTHPIVQREYCQMIKLFPTKEQVTQDPELDSGILNYSRTETAFAVISLVLMLIGLVFSIYSIQNPRYMFKRLAALMHFIVAACIILCVEVMISSVAYEEVNLPARHPENSHYSYGFSFILTWICFVIFVVAGIVFIVSSKKRKGEKAMSETEAQENEPVHLGRV